MICWHWAHCHIAFPQRVGKPAVRPRMCRRMLYAIDHYSHTRSFCAAAIAQGGSKESGRRGSMESGRRGSMERGRRGSMERGRRGSMESGRGSMESGRRGSMESGRRGSVESLQSNQRDPPGLQCEASLMLKQWRKWLHGFGNPTVGSPLLNVFTKFGNLQVERFLHLVLIT